MTARSARPARSAPNITLVRRLADVDRAEWDALVGATGSPFLEWDWLSALEESGCVSTKTGWAPHHVIVRDQGRLIAAAPMYLKSHSQGEFVFDHGWADAARRARLAYYPKLLVAVPFTPATGRRLLTHPEVPRGPALRVLAETLREVCVGSDLSSVHVNFCEDDEVDVLQQVGFLRRVGVQYHWRNRDYGTFEDYVAQLRSKRRNQLRRERREVAAAGFEITAHVGDAIPDDLFEPMFRIYLSTIDKLYWGRQYLNSQFFELLRQGWKRNLCFIVARRRGALVAGTVNVQKAGVLYGRYWGTFEEIRNLHFEVCYYAGIAHCIASGAQRFEPGAGGDFKYLRGFDPAPTQSMHLLSHPAFAEAVKDFLERERSYVDETIDELRERSPLKT